MKKHNRGGKGRVWVLLALCGAAFAVFAVRLAWMQFTQADHYAAKAQAAANAAYSVSVPAARGAITDRNGTLLAQDTAVYDLALCVPAPPGTTLQTTLEQLKRLDPTWGGKDVETQLAAFCSAVSAGELTIATALPPDVVAPLCQSGLVDSGAVRLTPRGTRCWPDGTLLPHTLGTTGPITAAQWQAGDYALRRAGVVMDAVLGQSGLEAAFDALLRGRDGCLAVAVDRRTGAHSETLTQAPAPGATLVLGLDTALQSVLQQALQDQIETLRTTKPAGKGREVTAGAAVVADVRSGSILAAASLPGYDLSQYRQGYAALSAAANAPLLDRVCSGLYAPGSAFKPAVAAAVLAHGTVTPQSTVPCHGRYTFYAGYQPHCLQLGHGGPVDLMTALKYSCNIYFYDVGRRVGVDAFSATAQALGLAADPGVELPCAAGRLTWSTDENYQAGLALQAAIGQGNTAVTPLQLVAYAAALANNGARPALHFAEKALDAAGQTVWQAAPRTLATAPGGAAVFDPIRAGMTQMSTTLAALRDAPVPVACKTGSPQLPGTLPDGTHYTHSVLIAYAPAAAPRIAVAVVLEQGGGGANAAPVLRAVLDAHALWQKN